MVCHQISIVRTCLFASFVLNGACLAQVWSNTGPTPLGGSNGLTGRITAVAIDPSEGNRWLLGSAGGGVWESRDSGASWTPLTDAQATLSVGAIAFAPGNPKIIYVGTGEAAYSGHVLAGQGILKSTDGGASWTLTGATTFARTSIGAIRVHPTNSNIAVAVMSRAGSGRTGDPFLGQAGPPPFGVQRTTDGGETWALTLAGEDTSLEVDPTNFDNQFTASGLPTGYGAYNPPAPPGVYRSNNGGQTWGIIPGPWSGTRTGRILLAIAPSDRNVLYASVQGPDSRLLGLYRTNSAWAAAPQWMQIPTTGNWAAGGSNYPDYCGLDCTQTHVLSVDPTDANTVFAGGASLWKCDSCDTNAVWTDVGSSIRNAKRCIAWSGTELIACTDGGVFSTGTKSPPWKDRNSGLQVARLISGTLHPSNLASGLASSWDNGFLVWSGTNWRSLAGQVGEVAMSRTRPNTDWMISGGSQLFRSTNGGTSITAADGGFDASGYNFGLMPVRKCPTNDDVFLAGAKRLYRSDNFFSGPAAAWSANAQAGDLITGTAFSDSDRSCNTYAYATATGRIFLTTDGGSSWVNVDAATSLPGRPISSLAFDPSNARTLYAAFSGFDQAGGKPGHLFKTTSALSASPKWVDISPGVNTPHNVIVVDPGNPASLYVGTDATVWYSSNGGSGWQFLGPSSGLPNAPVYDLKIDRDSGRIVAFTFGRGAWALDWNVLPVSGPLLSVSVGETEFQGLLGAEFSQGLSATGDGPFAWSIVSGALPLGLVLLSNGEIRGTPLSPGVYAFTVQVASASAVATQRFRVTVGTSGLAPVWTNIGPSPLIGTVNANSVEAPNAGRVATLAVDPSDRNHWMAGFGNGGVWESLDAGGSWRPIADAASSLTIGALAFAPGDSRIIYAGLGETTGPGFTKAGSGILKSVDKGENWILLASANFNRSAVKRIRVSSTDPNLLIAATSRGGFGRDSQEGAPSSAPFGILRSANGGTTWSRVLAGQATGLEVHPADFNRQYGSIGENRGPAGVHNDSAGSVVNGIYRSVDGGLTWLLIPGPWGVSTAARAAAGRIELAIAPSNPNVLYASISVPANGETINQGLLGLYRTDNAWAATPTWIQVPIAGTGDGSYCGPDKCTYSHVISVDPQDPNTIFAGGAENGLFRCTQCGASPEWINTQLRQPVHSDLHSLTWAGRELVLGNDGGIWSTKDLGVNWLNHNSTIATGMFYSGALHPTDPNMIVAGLRDFQLAVRKDGGWKTFPHADTWGEAEVAMSSSRPDTDWMGAWIWGVITRTKDGGATNTPAGGGIDTTGSAFVAPVRKCPNNDDVFLTGTNRMWRTNNFFSSAAPNWVANGPAHPYQFPWTGDAPGTIQTIEYVASDKTCNSYAYGNRGGEVRWTRDGGGTWTDLDPGKNLPGRALNWLAFDPANSNVLYAAISSFNDATPSKPGHVFKTTNALDPSPVWTNISPPQDQPFNVVAVEPLNSRTVYAGSDAGLWRSTDAGSTWIRQGAQVGMPGAAVYDIKMNPATGRTVVFTYGRSAFALGPEVLPGLVAANGGPPVDPTTGVPAPGRWVQIRGFNLAGMSRSWNEADFDSAAGDGVLPTTLSGIEVKVNGVNAPLSAIGPGLITFQMPDGLNGLTTVQVIRDGVPSNLAEVPSQLN